MIHFIEQVIGSAFAIILGGIITPAIINSIKNQTKDKRYKRAMLAICLEEIRSNLEEEKTEFTEVVNTTFGRFSYTAQKIIDLGILDSEKDKKIILLLLSILKKETDLLNRTNSLYSFSNQLNIQMMGSYANPSILSAFSTVASQITKKPIVQVEFIEKFQKMLNDEITSEYDQLKQLYSMVIEEIEKNYNLI